MTTDPTPKPESDAPAWTKFRDDWRACVGPGERFLLLLWTAVGFARSVAVRMQGWKTPSLGTLALLVVGAWFLFGRSSTFGAAEGGGPAGVNASEGMVTLVVQAILAAQGIALGARVNRTSGYGDREQYQPRRPYQPQHGGYSDDRPPPPHPQGGGPWQQ